MTWKAVWQFEPPLECGNVSLRGSSHLVRSSLVHVGPRVRGKRAFVSRPRVSAGETEAERSPAGVGIGVGTRAPNSFWQPPQCWYWPVSSLRDFILTPLHSNQISVSSSLFGWRDKMQPL